jgi:large subunit ribosomal protein L9
MKLILKQAVENLGEAGQLVTVKPGYGRNYLLPQGLAYAATPGNLKRIEEEQVRVEERSRRDYLEAKRRASQFGGLTLTFTARASEGDDAEARLFGSVGVADIMEELGRRGGDLAVERRQILLDEPIKALGSFPVTIRLHADVEVEIQVQVEREDG